MKRLLWREFREKWYWVPLLTAAASAPILFKDGYTFIGDLNIDRLIQWMLLPASLAALFGLGAYSSELARSTADFLFSRPISWKKMTAAKLITMLWIVIMAAMVSAVVYRIMCPVPYIKFATPLRLGEGIGISAGVMIVGYFIGAIFSVALPGTIGALTTLIAAAVFCATVFIGIGSLIEQAGIRKLMEPETFEPVWSFAGLIIGALVAAVIISRFGITLSTAARVKRYALIFILIALLLSLLDWNPTTRISYLSSKELDRGMVLSPDGRFAVLLSDLPQRAGLKIELLRLCDRKKVILPFRGVNDITWSITWAADGKLFMYRNLDTEHSSINVVWMTACGRLCIKSITAPPILYQYELLSPDHKIAILRSYENKSRKTKLLFLDVMRCRLLKCEVMLDRLGLEGIWWRSNTEIGYKVHSRGRQYSSSAASAFLMDDSVIPGVRHEFRTARVPRQ